MIASSPRPADPDTTGGELREESVDLTPGVVWTDAQLAVVRDLMARTHRAETALRAAHVAAPDTTDGELREAIARALREATSRGEKYPDTERMARRVLALPALRDLIVERDTLAAQVQAVEAEIAARPNAEFDPIASYNAFHAMRRALGTQTTGGGE